MNGVERFYSGMLIVNGAWNPAAKAQLRKYIVRESDFQGVVAVLSDPSICRPGVWAYQDDCTVVLIYNDETRSVAMEVETLPVLLRPSRSIWGNRDFKREFWMAKFDQIIARIGGEAKEQTAPVVELLFFAVGAGCKVTAFADAESVRGHCYKNGITQTWPCAIMVVDGKAHKAWHWTLTPEEIDNEVAEFILKQSKK
jgi:hypothetical protein